jgi:hypothetical protein
MASDESTAVVVESVVMKHFLEATPPGKAIVVSDFVIERAGDPALKQPYIALHCRICDGERFFETTSISPNLRPASILTFQTYNCRNCRRSPKTYAIQGLRSNDVWHAKKFGEIPEFGPPIPSKAIALIGADRDDFLKGRRAENQGLGVGAFAYYRRVVENQKARIFDEIVRVSRHLGADTELIADLQKAKSETQFTKAVDAIKHALPQFLLINGSNPLTLLHSALSEGVHNLNDAECLELAGSVREILFEFADRLAQAMKDHAGLNDAVNRLSRAKSKPRPPPSTEPAKE